MIVNNEKLETLVYRVFVNVQKGNVKLFTNNKKKSLMRIMCVQLCSLAGQDENA